jgi:hypothetical protein
MERAPAVALEKENAMLLLKIMVLLGIVSVILTLYAEYRRMTKFEKLLHQLSIVNEHVASSSGLGRTRAVVKRTPSLSAQEEHNDKDVHMPTP